MARRKIHRKSENRRKFREKFDFSANPGKVHWKLFIACLIVVFFVAAIGSAYTKIDSWYDSVKPSITPANWVFPVVWTVLFYLIAVSLYYAWLYSNEKQKKKILWYFAINFFLNVLWSVLYFTMHNPLYAFFDIILLLISIIYLIVFNWKIKKEASYFLIPYLLWVGFASVLNYLTILNMR